MAIHMNKAQGSKSHTTDSTAKNQEPGRNAIQLKDHRPEAIAQMELQEMANNSPQVQHSKTNQAMADGSARVQQLKAVQDMANEQAGKTLQQKENTEEEMIQHVAEPLQKKKQVEFSKDGQAIQRVVDPAKLKGRLEFIYKQLPISLMKNQHKAHWEAFLQQAADVAELTTLVNDFLAAKTQERKDEEAARKAASAAKHQANVEEAQALAEARRVAEAEKRAAEEAAAELARIAAAAEAARVAAEAAAAAAAIAAEQARLNALFAPGVHKVLSVNDIDSFMQNGYFVNHGEEYNDKTGTNEHGERIHDYGIYININSGAGASMTTHFHVHAGIGAGGPWDAHFKNGMGSAANQGGYVSRADALQLFTTLGYNP